MAHPIPRDVREQHIEYHKNEADRLEKEIAALKSGTPLPMQVVIADSPFEAVNGPWDKQIAGMESELSEHYRCVRMWEAA